LRVQSSHHKELIIIARARDRHHVYELENAGANYTIRETFESANLAAIEALTAFVRRHDYCST
jgi:voltage-gated potassium channel Kch